jgi:carotenoid cleavage dioxygenase
MQRRHVLRLAGAYAAGSAVALPIFAQATADPWMADFRQAEASQPWTLGYRTPAGDFTGASAHVSGRFPAAVQGVLFRNGPAVHDMGGQRYQHWFDGDGMVQRYAITATGVTHSGKVVHTPKFVAEKAAGKRLLEAFGSKWPGLQQVTGPDAFNAANTSVLAINGELLALWEGGSAFAMDPMTLETRGAKVWSPETRGVPFSAHPRVDADGTVWNFGVSALSDMLVLYEIGPDAKLRRAQPVRTPHTSYVHDFAITERHLVFLLPPLVLERGRMHDGNSFVDSHVWRPELGMRVLVVDKADFSRQQWLELPAGFMFHLGNAWEDAQGIIRVDYVHAATPDALYGTDRALMRGQMSQRPEYHIATARLDPARGQASQELLTMQAEFPRIDPRLTGRRHRHLLHATQSLPTHPGFSAVARTAVETGRTDIYSYGADHLVEEHLFIPEPGTAPGGAGWVLGTALDLKQRRTVLTCFRADRLANGPVAQAKLPYALPLGLHATFTPA